ncbi:MAG: HAD family hydrolase [Anaerovoracaceae bacterium]|jgi:phosphonoacetaldehyde hydrolase
MKGTSRKIKLVIFDTAGTITDGPADLRARWPEDDGKGCKAPVLPFYEALKNHGVTCSWETIRKPMGIYKPEHMRWLLAEPGVVAQWKAAHGGKEPTEEDYNVLMDEFRSLLTRYILDEDLSKPIAGTRECIDRLRRAGFRIAFDTGYFADDADQLNAILADRWDIRPDAASNGDRVPGRPTPFMIFDNMQQIYEQDGEVFGTSQVVKIDDTATGIRSGNNAGAWTIGVYASGSNSYDELLAAEPDFLVPDVSYVPDIVVHEIENRRKETENGEKAEQ